MAMVKIVTDSNSGISQAEAERLGISVIPMPFVIDGEQYFEDVDLTQAQFYEHLRGDASVSTSQPSSVSVTEVWEALINEGYDVVHIPMSSALSESCHTAQNLAKDYGGKVQVVDNRRISITLKQSVYDALSMAGRGMSAKEIARKLEQTSEDSSIYLTLETLKYLKKGGRLTPAAALIGTILRVKPVLQIQGGKLDAFKKVQTVKQAKQVMIDALKSDLATRFADYVAAGEMRIFLAHTEREKEIKEFADELAAAFPNIPVSFCDPLPLSIACHVGPGVIACSATRCLN